MKPAKLTYLLPGKAVGAHPGFAATFNWLVRFCNNLAGDNITATVDRQNDGDNPVVRCIGQIGGGGSVSGYTTPGGTTATERRLVNIRWNSSSNGKLEGLWATVRYEDGLLKTYVEDQTWTQIFATADHSNEPLVGSNA